MHFWSFYIFLTVVFCQIEVKVNNKVVSKNKIFNYKNEETMRFREIEKSRRRVKYKKVRGLKFYDCFANRFSLKVRNFKRTNNDVVEITIPVVNNFYLSRGVGKDFKNVEYFYFRPSVEMLHLTVKFVSRRKLLRILMQGLSTNLFANSMVNSIQSPRVVKGSSDLTPSYTVNSLYDYYDIYGFNGVRYDLLKSGSNLTVYLQQPSVGKWYFEIISSEKDQAVYAPLKKLARKTQLNLNIESKFFRRLLKTTDFWNDFRKMTKLKVNEEIFSDILNTASKVRLMRHNRFGTLAEEIKSIDLLVGQLDVLATTFTKNFIGNAVSECF